MLPPLNVPKTRRVKMWGGLVKKYTEAVYRFSQFQAIYNAG